MVITLTVADGIWQVLAPYLNDALRSYGGPNDSADVLLKNFVAAQCKTIYQQAKERERPGVDVSIIRIS